MQRQQAPPEIPEPTVALVAEEVRGARVQVVERESPGKETTVVPVSTRASGLTREVAVVVLEPLE